MTHVFSGLFFLFFFLRRHNQQQWLNQLDTVIKKAAGDISSHLCPLVCESQSVSTCMCVCKMSASNKAAGGVCWGAWLCLPTPPPPPPCPVRVTECAAMMCPLAKPTALLFSPPCLVPLFVSLNSLHNVHLSQPFFIMLLCGRQCHSCAVWMCDCPLCDPSSLSLSFSHSSSLMVTGAGSSVKDPVSVNYCPVFLFESWCDRASHGSHTCLSLTH